MSRAGRAPGIDCARGLAVVLMIQTHGYDAWVSGAARPGVAYQLTRLLGAAPAPLFLLLAGVGLQLSYRPGDPAGRWPWIWRGLKLVGGGYLLSVVYALLDRTPLWPDVLRADILHCLGLSIALCAAVLLGRSWRPALGLGLVALVAGPLVGARGLGLVPPPGLEPLIGLLIDAPPYTRFPLFPLVVFAVLGVTLAPMLSRPISARRAWALAAACCGLAWLGHLATGLAVSALGGRLDRAHPAVVFNVVDGAARALAVVWIGTALAAAGRGRGVSLLAMLGRRSLLAYALHVPLCYGRLGRPLWHALGMAPASLAVGALVAITGLVCWAADSAARRSAVHRPAPAASPNWRCHSRTLESPGRLNR